MKTNVTLGPFKDLDLLLPVHESHYKGETRQFTFARALYEFLGVKTRFNDWFSRAVEDADFVENIDYWLMFNPKNLGLKKPQHKDNPNLFYSNLSNKKRTETRGRKQTDYKITLDMAKELAMLERNEQGKLARRYFIQCEKALQTVAPQLSSELLLQWKVSREQTGKGYRPLCAALDRNRQRQGKPTPKYLYGNESNMLTGIVLGMSVKHYKAVYSIEDDVRSHLTADQLAELEYLERADEMLLDSDVNDFETRRLKLIAMRNNRFGKAA